MDNQFKREQTLTEVSERAGNAFSCLRDIGSMQADGLTFDAAWIVRKQVWKALQAIDKIQETVSGLKAATNF